MPETVACLESRYRRAKGFTGDSCMWVRYHMSTATFDFEIEGRKGAKKAFIKASKADVKELIRELEEAIKNDES